jgi:uncharacterized protein YcbX
MAESLSSQGHVCALFRYPVKSMLGERLTEAAVGLRGLAGDRAYAVVDRRDGRIATGKHPRKWSRLVELSAAFVDEPAGDLTPPVAIAFPDGTTLRSDDPRIDQALSTFLGRDVSLVKGASDGQTLEEVWPLIDGLAPTEVVASMSGGRNENGEPVTDIPVSSMAPEGTFFDLTTLHVLTTATLQHLSALEPAADFDVRRYRPNVLVEPAAADPAGAQPAAFPENEWVGATLRLGAQAQARVDMPTMRCVMTTLGRDGMAPDRRTLQTIARHNRIEINGMGPWACAGVYATVTVEGALTLGDLVALAP